MAGNRTEVTCIGSATPLLHGLSGEAVSSVALSVNSQPLLLIGVGGGVLRSAYRCLGALPSCVFLPSARLSAMTDLQAYIQHLASLHHNVRVFAAGPVLDKLVSILDEDIAAGVKDYVEFLQVEPNTPTSLTDSHFMVMQPVVGPSEDSHLDDETAALQHQPRYNVVVLDLEQRVLLSYFEGLPSKDKYVGAMRSAPCLVVNLWPGYTSRELLHHLNRDDAPLHVIGFSKLDHLPNSVIAPGVPWRTGASFVLPSLSHLPGSPPSSDTRELRWLQDNTNMNQHASHQPPASATLAQESAAVSLVPPTHTFSRSSHVANRSDARAEPDARSPPRPRSSTPSRHGSKFRTFPVPSYDPKGTIFASPVTAPIKLCVFSNENLSEEPAVVMVNPAMTFKALKMKISRALHLLPIGGLYTVEQGLIHDLNMLHHGDEVVATKHGGVPFNLRSLPRYMRKVPDFQSP